MNDLTYLEAARELARQSMTREKDTKSRLAFIFRRVLSRDPSSEEQKVMTREWQRAAEHYGKQLHKAIELLNFGQPETRQSDVPATTAAYTVVASTILNLDEAITHE